uniref:TetR/AcrR family transcriptional regulator n=1 Tax=Nocardia vinacea TaxID=96468 RepID=UPI0012F6A741
MAQRGVEGTSTRDVASTAGVNQALVYRYFGSKEKLFAEAAGTSAPNAIINGTPLADLAVTLLDHTLDVSVAPAADEVGGIARFLGAANDDTVRAIIRDRIDITFGSLLAARLDGPDAALRAELLAALITGIAFLRNKVETRSLSSADRATLGAYVASMAAPILEVEPKAAADGFSALDGDLTARQNPLQPEAGPAPG